jgi:glycine/D-amino acid oxidase-like deaminating enzyme
LNDLYYYVIVIGGGIADLSAAAHLKKKGKMVVVFEQPDKSGGYYMPFCEWPILASHWVGPSGIYNFAIYGKNGAELILRHE